MSSTELGFLVSAEKGWRIWDSAKFGGKPFWLIPDHIPSCDDVRCKECHNPMCFMMQLYNPCDDIPEAYHRCIYVFVCRNQACLEKGNMKVLRCELPLKNKYYPEDLDSVDGSCYFDPSSPASPLHYGNHLCSVCGLKATSKCAKCNVYYCCRDHQLASWHFDHKQTCGKGNQSIETLYADSHVCPNVQFPLWEVDMFPEPKPPKREEVIEQQELEKIRQLDLGEEDKQITEEDLREALGGRLEDDPVRLHFNKVINRASTQVLRLNRWNNDAILWANQNTRLNLQEVPKCPYCGAERAEQTSHKTDFPQIDFGSLVVFTCCKSCNNGDLPYMEEYVYYHSHYSQKDMDDMKKQIANLSSQ